MALIDGINFIQYNENMVGANHPLALTDTLNRALIEFITKLDTGGGDTQVMRTNVKIASSTDIAAGVVSDDIVWFNPSSLKWEKAIDDNAVGIIDVENLMVLISGMYTFKTINNLTVGTKYYLDASTPGAITDLDSSGVLVGTAFGTGTILNVTTSGSSLDADTLDGLDSTQFARTDVAETFSSSVTASSFIGDGSQLTGISSTSSVNYISKNANYTASANDFIYCDTKPIAQVDEVTVATVANSTDYTVTINGTAFTYTSSTNATSGEIVSGLISAINGGSEPVTASGTTTLILTADVAGTAFSDSVSTNLSVSTITENDIGDFTITLPANPSANARIGILDNTSNFDKNPLTIARNGNTIMGVNEDMIVSTKNISLELIFNGNDWRIK